MPPLLHRVLLLLLIATALWFLVRLFEWRNVYVPSRRVQFTPRDAGYAYEEVEFYAEDGTKLHGWWVPVAAEAGTLIYCHGNAGNIGDRVHLVNSLRSLGVNIFIFDYRGYGQSRGIPTERGTYRDARAAYEVVRARYGEAERPPIAVLGRSLGGAVAVQLALDCPVRALVTESSFTSTTDMARHLFPGLPARLLCRIRYDSRAKVGRLRMPKLFAHSPADEIVPYALGRELFEAAAEPKRFVQLEGGHNDASWMTTPAYFDALRALMDEVGLRSEGARP